MIAGPRTETGKEEIGWKCQGIKAAIAATPDYIRKHPNRLIWRAVLPVHIIFPRSESKNVNTTFLRQFNRLRMRIGGTCRVRNVCASNGVRDHPQV